MKMLKFFALVFLPFWGNTANAMSHLCSANEAVLFTCGVGRKTLSLCSSLPLTPTDGYVQYRFGTKSKLELTFPTRKLHPRDQFLVRDWHGAGIDQELILSFENGGYVYALHYTYVSVRPGMEGNSSLDGFGSFADLSVSKQGEVIRSADCVHASQLDWPNFLPTQPLER